MLRHCAAGNPRQHERIPMKHSGSPRPVTRRSFFGQLAIGATALAVAPYVRGQPAAPKKLGVAIIGLGNYARGQIGPGLRLTQHCELRGVVTGSPEKGAQWAKDYGFSDKNIWNYETMSQMADNKDIDLVYVITPNALHAPHTIAAAKAGKHVMCEKPMAMNVAECDAMTAACKAAKVKLSIGYRLHFDPFTKELKRLAKDKDFGAFMKMSGGNGFRMGRKVWRAEYKLAGGGPLMDMGVYSVQAACMAADGATPVAAIAKEHPKTRPEVFADVEEGLDYTLEFANGAKAELMTSYNQNIGKFRAEGDKGWAELDPAHGYRGIKLVTSKGPSDIAGVPSQQALQMDDFALCVRENRESIVGAEMGRRDMRIVEAIYASAAQAGKRIEVKA
jgi:glucose-fructose oxidoreductase